MYIMRSPSTVTTMMMMIIIRASVVVGRGDAIVVRSGNGRASRVITRTRFRTGNTVGEFCRNGLRRGGRGAVFLNETSRAVNELTARREIANHVVFTNSG